MDLVYSSKDYGTFLRDLLAEAEKASPRGLETLEVVNAHLTLNNPRDRVVSNTARRINPAFAVAEFISTLLGYDDLKFFTQFIKSYDKFSSDGVTLDGAYGTRLHLPARKWIVGETEREWPALNAIKEVVKELKKDKESRRAVINIRFPEDFQGFGGKNSPCTLSLQFLVRQSVLHCITTMRSNDAWKGTPYDVFQFTLLQEYMANCLKLPLGQYYHNAGSLHLYREDALKVPLVWEGKSASHFMCKMPSLTSGDLDRLDRHTQETLFDHDAFFSLTRTKWGWSSPKAHEYCVTLLATMRAFLLRHTDAFMAKDSLAYVSDRCLSYALKPWIRQEE